RAFPDALAGARGALGGTLSAQALDGAGNAALPDDLRARFARGFEERGLEEGRQLWRMGDQDPPAIDEPPPQRFRTHHLRGKDMIHVVAVITAKSGMREAILK